MSATFPAVPVLYLSAVSWVPLESVWRSYDKYCSVGRNLNETCGKTSADEVNMNKLHEQDLL